MSYSSLNDAFNINSNFQKTIRGINTGDNESEQQFESNYFGNMRGQNNADTNYQNNFYNPNDPLPIIDGMFEDNDNMSWESLNGTDLYSRTDNNTSLSSSNKLTHRECINIYNNPDSFKDSILTHALKHVSKCKTCKGEIKKSILSNSSNKQDKLKKQNKNQESKQAKLLNLSNSSNPSNSSSSSNLSNSLNKKKLISDNGKDNLSLLSYQNFHNPTNSGSLNLSSNHNSKIESELKQLSEKINGETNLKYQNALIQNNISKYLEDLEERKKINQKLDKIIEMINLDLIAKHDANDKKNISSESKEANLLNLLTSSQFLSNLSKISELNNTNNNMNNVNDSNVNSNTNTTSYQSYLLYIAIFIILILLIIDVVLRFNSKQ
jgi:hypothetical protein